MKLKTYGKANKISMTFSNLMVYKKNKFVNGLEIYKPKLNKVRVSVWGTIACLSAIIPFTFAPITVPLAIQQALK